MAGALHAESRHEAVVDAWLARSVDHGSSVDLARLFQAAFSEVWTRTVAILGPLTLGVLAERVHHNTSERYSFLSDLDRRWIDDDDAPARERLYQRLVAVPRDTLIEGLRHALVELLTMIGALTAEVLRGELAAGLDAATASCHRPADRAPGLAGGEATTAAAGPTNGHRRLEPLYEVGKLFNAFTRVDETVGKALRVVSATLPLESALLIQATITCHTEIFGWRCEDGASTRLHEAKAHAEAVYAYLVGAKSIDTLELHDRPGSTMLPVPPRDRAATEHARFVVIPLVVARGSVFGALQIEVAAELDRDDVGFIAMLADQLAIALDRDRSRRHDVVRRREAQLAQARYEGVIDRLDSAFVWESDLEVRRMSYVSAQVEQLLGFSRRECLDEHDWWRSHVHPDDRDLLADTFARALVERGHQRCDHRIVAADATIRWLHTSVHLADVPGELPRLQGLSYDITATRGEPHRMQPRVAVARTANPRIEGDTLAVELDGAVTFVDEEGASSPGHNGAGATTSSRGLAAVTRELTSPLAAISLASRMLGRGKPGRRRRRTGLLAVARIRRATGRIQRLVDDVVDFASIEDGGLEIVIRPHGVAAIVAEVTASFERLARARGVRLVGDSLGDVPPIHCDRDGVLRVLANLVGNALRVVDRGGSVRVHVKHRETEAVFVVSDTGPGIAVAEHASLFDPYWRSPSTRYPGLGLGLAVARDIVERHGGRIWADSELGAGATFFFTMPLAGA
jgi:signal transduction histidine kinase